MHLNHPPHPSCGGCTGPYLDWDESRGGSDPYLLTAVRPSLTLGVDAMTKVKDLVRGASDALRVSREQRWHRGRVAETHPLRLNRTPVTATGGTPTHERCHHQWWLLANQQDLS